MNFPKDPTSWATLGVLVVAGIYSFVRGDVNAGLGFIAAALGMLGIQVKAEQAERLSRSASRDVEAMRRDGH